MRFFQSFKYIVLFIYINQALASELTVYRWVDKNNVVHFSQHQPIGDEYTQFLVSNESRMISRADQVIYKTPSDDQKTSTQQSEQALVPTINISEKCRESEENVSMLLAFDKVQYTDEKGNKKVLTKQEKQQQLAINQKRTEVYCAPTITE